MMIRYIHGSEDSLDLDVFYVFDFLHDINECKRFCSEDDTENRNISILIKNDQSEHLLILYLGICKFKLVLTIFSYPFS